MPARPTATKDPAATLDAVFFALSDRTRRSLLGRLRGREETAGALAEGFDVSRPAISRHLRILREASLVRERRRGRERVYALAPERLAAIGEWLDGYRLFWAARLHDLKGLVESLPDAGEASRAAPALETRARRPPRGARAGEPRRRKR